MNVTFDPDNESLERVIAVIEALYDVRLNVDEAEGGPGRKMRH
jgi:hypothetical protein